MQNNNFAEICCLIARQHIYCGQGLYLGCRRKTMTRVLVMRRGMSEMSEMIVIIMLVMTTQMMRATMIETHSTDLWGRSRIEKNYVFGIFMVITGYNSHSIKDLFCSLQIG
ncbi:hypothetical protein GOODEAATRI_001540 [Goodea atripinnis]|uniref:NADH dehydrogenase subunit 4L n=1 Tax=Goodea atripinnis TaxID=208336 RepID=A0ABV0P0M2_9TELE